MTAPNILWIYCDELRTDALGCYGNPYAEMQTPHIDALAARGVRFDNCFCNSPVCVASRTSVLTGLYPEQTGVYHNEATWPAYRFNQQFDNPPLTFPAHLAQNGYRTANFGKVHVPAALDAWQHSETRGAGMAELYQGVDKESLQMIRPPGIPTVIGGVYPGNRPYPPDAVTKNALRWLAQGDRPFLARVSLLQPHTPVFPPPPFDALYRSAPFPDSISRDCSLSRFEARFAEVIRAREMSAQEILLAHVHYYGLVAWIDSQVGRLLNFLDTQDLREQTIVIFDADHGASLGECGRFQKQTFAPESHRVPRIVAWPGTLPAQTRSDLCESLDLARTLCALADVPVDPQFKGRDLFHEPAPDAVYATIGYGERHSRAFPNLGVGDYGDNTGSKRGWPRRACIRTSQYRLDKNLRIDGKPVNKGEADIFLADVQADPAETVNVANDSAHQQTVARLNALLDDHVADAVEVPSTWTRRSE